MRYDLIVAGAGPSGITAALAAARLGEKVLLVDKNPFPGGTNTASMVCPLMGFHSGKRQIIKGIAQEIIDRLKERGATLGHVNDPIGEVATITPIEPSQLRFVYFDLISREKNIHLLLNTFVSDVGIKNGRIDNITIVNKAGTSKVSGNYFIDATGDGDLAAIAKVNYDVGRASDSLSQPMTLIFKVGNVDFKKIREYIHSKPEQFVCEELSKIDNYVAVSGYFDLVQKAKDNDDFDIPRDRVLFFEGINPNEIFVNTTRIIRKSGLNPEDLTSATLEAYKQIDILMAFFRKYVPGFEDSYVVEVANQIGVRESRRFHCIDTLRLEDIYEEKARDDSIAVCAYPIDIHDPNGSDLTWIKTSSSFAYDIPYGVMVPNKYENLLITGRCLSAEHEAQASVRITPTMMAVGQAAGTAAHLAVSSRCSFKDVDIGRMQDILRNNGAIVTKKDL